MQQPRKRFGQNFLIDPGTIDALVRAIAPKPDDAMLEIGPGRGALTQPLLNIVRRLEVVEIDRNLIQQLQNLEYREHLLLVYQCDVLKFDFSADRISRRIVGNLPYNISTPLIFHLLKHITWIQDMHFMLQKEVVDRICATAGSRAYGRLSVMLQARCEVQKLLEIDAEKFLPQPKVTSGFVRLKPLQQPMVTPKLEAGFAHVVKSAFAHPRKTLGNNLKGLLDSAALKNLGIDPAVRPQQLNIEAFLTITRALRD